MTREEIRRKFDEIVAFAEVEKFLDTDAAKNTVGVSDVSNPAAVAHSAVTQAAQKFAPGLVNEPGLPEHRHHRRTSGRWVRRGNQIILFGV